MYSIDVMYYITADRICQEGDRRVFAQKKNKTEEARTLPEGIFII